MSPVTDTLMPPSSSRSTSPGSAPLAAASALRRRLLSRDSSLAATLAGAYGAEPALLSERTAAAVRTLDRFLDTFGDLPCALYRAPARLSPNPHCDHQGAWVPYGLHCRELLAVAAPADDD